MTDKESLGIASILGQFLNIKKAFLVLKTQQIKGQEYRDIYIEFGEGTNDGWFFRIDDMPVSKVRNSEDLIRARLHFEDTSGPSDDDTLGSDPTELIETSGWFFGCENGMIWKFDKLLIDFDHLGDKKFRLHIECLLFNFDDFEKYTEGK